MERFKVSGGELRGHYGDSAVTLARVFGDIEKELQSEKKVVCQYLVNGHAVPERDEAIIARLSIGEIETLEYVSEHSDVLLRDVIDGWQGALPELIQGADRLSDSLRGANPAASLPAVLDLLTNCEYLIGSLLSLRMSLGDTRAASIHGWEGLEKLTHQTVRLALAALEREDLVLLSQLIEYDLGHVFEEWRRLLNGIKALPEGTLRNGQDQRPREIGQEVQRPTVASTVDGRKSSH